MTPQEKAQQFLDRAIRHEHFPVMEKDEAIKKARQIYTSRSKTRDPSGVGKVVTYFLNGIKNYVWSERRNFPGLSNEDYTIMIERKVLAELPKKYGFLRNACKDRLKECEATYNGKDRS